MGGHCNRPWKRSEGDRAHGLLPHLDGWAHDCLIRLDQGSGAQTTG
jgi:hypothetical protein